MSVIGVTVPIIMASSSVAITHLAAVFLLPVAVRQFRLLVPIYIFAMLITAPMEIRMNAASVDLFTWTVQDSLSLGAAAVLLINKSKLAATPLRYDAAFISLFVVLVFIEARGTSSTNLIRILVQTGIHYGVPYLIMSRAISGVDDIRAAMMALAFSGCLLSFIALFELAFSWPLYRVFYEQSNVDIGGLFVKTRGGLLRPGGPFLEPTSYAGTIALCVLATWYSRDTFRAAGWRWLLGAVLTLGVLAPQARNALLALILGIVGAELYRRRMGLVALASSVGGAIMALALLRTGGAMGAIIGTGQGAETVQYRERLLARGLEEIARSPHGNSVGIVQLRLRDLAQGEGIIDFVNTYLYVALHAGVFGLGAWLIAIFVWPIAMIRVRGRVRTKFLISAMSFIFVVQCIPIVRLVHTSFGSRPAIFFFVFMGMAVSAFRISRGRSGRYERVIVIPVAPKIGGAKTE